MPDILKAILLGIIQGLTEFLPVSSSGHLELGKSLLNMDFEGDQSLAFTVWLHLATAFSTLVFFRKTIGHLLRSSLQKTTENGRESRRYIGFIALSMLPAGFVGLFFEDTIDAYFYGNVMAVSLCLLFTAALLFFAQSAPKKEGRVHTKSSIAIGLAQAVALLPGISRSGSTIAAALLLGIDRERAARFSFLMVLPLIFAKVAKDLLDAFLNGNFQALALDTPTVLAALAAFVTGLLACKWMLHLVKRLKLTGFAIYCALIGVLGLLSTFFV